MAGNAFADLIPGGEASAPNANSFTDLVPKKAPTGPTLAPAEGKPSSLSTLLDVQRNALAKKVTGKATPEAQTEAEWSALGVTPQQRAKEPGWYRGLTNTAMQTVTDPLTYETMGLGPALKGARAGLEAVGEAAPKIAAKAPETVKAAERMGQGVHDFFTFAGQAKRDVGKPIVQEILGAAQRIGNRVGPQGKLMNQLVAKVGRAAKGLSPEEVSRVENALQGFVNPADLTPKEEASYRIFDTTRKRLANLSDIAHKMDPTMMKPERMSGWVPLPPTERELVEGRAAVPEINSLEGFDPHILERRAPSRPLTPKESPAALKAWESAIRSKGSLLQGKVLTPEVKRILGAPGAPAKAIPESVRAMFSESLPATGRHMTSKDLWGRVWNMTKSAPKTAVVGTTPGHMANVTGLALTQPGGARAVGEALSHMPANWKSVATTGERTTPLIDWLGKGTSLPARAGVGGAAGAAYGAYMDPKDRLKGALEGGAIGATGGAAAPGWMRTVNRGTWALDKGLTDAFARQATEGGMNADRAAQEAREMMVDYEHLSPFAEYAKKIMPFGTWNTGIWKQVVSAVVKNPARAAAINRATGGFWFGSTTDTGTPIGKVESLLPQAEVGRVLGAGGVNLPEAAKFARKTTAQPLNIVEAVKEVAERPKTKWPFSTYGLNPTKPVDQAKIAAQILLLGVPESETALGAAGMGPFKPDSFMSELLRQGTRTLPLSK